MDQIGSFVEASQEMWYELNQQISDNTRGIQRLVQNFCYQDVMLVKSYYKLEACFYFISRLAFGFSLFNFLLGFYSGSYYPYALSLLAILGHLAFDYYFKKYKARRVGKVSQVMATLLGMCVVFGGVGAAVQHLTSKNKRVKKESELKIAALFPLSGFLGILGGVRFDQLMRWVSATLLFNKFVNLIIMDDQVDSFILSYYAKLQRDRMETPGGFVRFVREGDRLVRLKRDITISLTSFFGLGHMLHLIYKEHKIRRMRSDRKNKFLKSREKSKRFGKTLFKAEEDNKLEAKKKNRRGPTSIPMKQFGKLYDGDIYEVYDSVRDTWYEYDADELRDKIAEVDYDLYVHNSTRHEEFDLLYDNYESSLGKSSIKPNDYHAYIVCGDGGQAMAPCLKGGVVLTRHILNNKYKLQVKKPGDISFVEIEIDPDTIVNLSHPELILLPHDSFSGISPQKRTRVRLGEASDMMDLLIVSHGSGAKLAGAEISGGIGNESMHTGYSTDGYCGSFVVNVSKSQPEIVGFHAYGENSLGFNGYCPLNKQDIDLLALN